MVQYTIIAYAYAEYVGETVTEEQEEDGSHLQIDDHRPLHDRDTSTSLHNGWYRVSKSVVYVQSGGNYVNDAFQQWLAHENISLLPLCV